MKKLMIAAATVAMAVVAGAAQWDGAFESLTLKGKALGVKKAGAKVSVISTKYAGLYDVKGETAYIWNTDSKMKIKIGKAKMFVCDDIIPGKIALLGKETDAKSGRSWQTPVEAGAFAGFAFGNAKSASGNYVAIDKATGETYGTWKIAQDKTLASLQKKTPSAGLVDVLLKKKVELESNLTADEKKAYEDALKAFNAQFAK